MSTPTALTFPVTAETMKGNAKFQNYRIFLDHWNEYLTFLTDSFQKIHVRDESFCLVVYGPQGIGKSVFAEKLRHDFEITKTDVHANRNFDFNLNNIWHRIAANSDPKNIIQLQNATRTSIVKYYDDNDKWVKDAISSSEENSTKIIILDNADSAYFGASLTDTDIFTYIQHEAEPSTAKLVAQKFVRLARKELKRTLFILLGNKPDFLMNFKATCESEHRDMVEMKNFPVPSKEEKEKIVRVNINRLNEVSYWACIDASGPEFKKKLYNTLKGDETFRAAFASVDNAYRSKRIGREANKCLITLVVMTKDLSNGDDIAKELGGTIIPILNNDIVRIYHISKEYCQNILGPTEEAKLLESEFTLRLVLLSENWVRALLGGVTSQQTAINALKTYFLFQKKGLNTLQKASIKNKQEASSNLLLTAPDLAGQDTVNKFWDANQSRSSQYETILAKYFDYNKVMMPGFPKRPDLVLEPYTVCSVLTATKVEDINKTIERRCHVVEFTAQKNATALTVKNYLKNKLQDVYIQLLREH